MKNTEIIRKFDPSQPRDEDGQWTNTGQGEKIKVYRGTGRNYAEGENEGFLWVSTDKSVASNYADLDDEGNLMVEEFEIEKPKKPFKFGYSNPNQYVTAENVGNIWRRELTKLAKAKKITIDEWRKTSDLIRDWEKMAGSKVEMLHTLLNKTSTAKTSAQIIFNLGYDALEISEGDSVTYGLLKNVKNLEYNFILKFDPNQPRDESGKWTNTGGSSSTSEDSNQESTKLTIDEKYYLREYTRNGYSEYNQYLANPDSSFITEAQKYEYEQQIEYIKSALKKLGQDPENIFEGIVFRGDVWKLEDRGLKSYNRTIDMFKNALDNDSLVNYNVFMSTTQDFKQALDFAQPRSEWGDNYGQIMYSVITKNGAKIDSYSAYPKELEILFAPGTKFKVTEMVNRVNDIWTIMLEVQDAESKSINLNDYIQKFDPDQARDESGKWTDTGASSTSENSELLTDAEFDAISQYTGADFREINTYNALKNDPEKLLEWAEKNNFTDNTNSEFIESLEAKSQRIIRGLNKLRKNESFKDFQFTGDVFRGDSWQNNERGKNSYNRQLALFSNAFDQDTIVNYNTFMSTSTDSNVGNSFVDTDNHYFQIYYHVKVKDAPLIENISQYKDEHEVLLVPNSKFKVISIDQDVFVDTQTQIITLELLN